MKTQKPEYTLHDDWKSSSTTKLPRTGLALASVSLACAQPVLERKSRRSFLVQPAMNWTQHKPTRRRWLSSAHVFTTAVLPFTFLLQMHYQAARYYCRGHGNPAARIAAPGRWPCSRSTVYHALLMVALDQHVHCMQRSVRAEGAGPGQSTGFACPRQYDVSIIDRDLHFPMIRTGIISIFHT